MKKRIIIGLLALCAMALSGCNKQPDPFIFGADISWVPQDEARGTIFSDEGEEKDILAILKEHGFNYIRLRLFVDPTAPRGYSRDGFCGLESTMTMAERIKEADMKFLLDFHYSDTWADPDKQYKPSAWEGLTGEALDNALYEYTKEVLTAMKERGVAPNMIQLGNEIDHGMVWPEGRINDNSTPENWDAFANLYKAGQRAAREVLPEAELMLHLAIGGQNNLCRRVIDNLTQRGAEFDIIGLSYYDQWHGTFDDLKFNLRDLAERYGKPLTVCEYNGPNIERINDIVRSVPDGMGIGTMFWEPTRRNLFSHGETTEMIDIYPALAARYADPRTQPNDSEVFDRTFEFDEPMIGADISWVDQQESRGTKFSDEEGERDVLEIMKSKGFNWIRLRLFVDPTSENGYSAEGFCGTERTLMMAKRIKEAGMKFLLDFHYSDNWADPGKQFKPAAWEHMNGSQLEGTVYNYTRDIIEQLIAQGTTPDMVQIGNEINHGMLWPSGKVENSSYMSLGVILRCASAGVRAADPNIKVMLHTACGGQNEESVAFFDKIIAQDVVFDVIGQSYYPKWHGTLDDLRNNLTDLAARYGRPIVVVEYQDHKREVNEVVGSLPDGMGVGTFIWEATSPMWGGLFDRNGMVTDSMSLYPDIKSLYSLK